MNLVHDISNQIQKRRISGVLLLALAIGVCGGFVAGVIFGLSFFSRMLTGIILFLVVTAIAKISGFLSSPSDEEIIRFLDRNYPFVEETAYLLTKKDKTIFEEWQLQKILTQIGKHQKQIELPNRSVTDPLYLSLAIGLMTLIFTQFYTPSEDHLQFAGQDRGLQPVQTTAEEAIPGIINMEIDIIPPGYTNLDRRKETPGNSSVPELSQVEWAVKTNETTETVQVTFNDRSTLQLEKSDGIFRDAMTIQNHQIYQISASNPDTTTFTDYYGISVIPDEPPQLVFRSPGEQRSFITEQNRNVYIDVQILDDYGITDASIHATLARGSGESVRFTDQDMDFDSLEGLGSTNARGRLNLNADSLEMLPGDEFYFYVTATDNHPEPQTGRSPTYFVIYTDTTRSQGITAGNIVVDLMPEDFRSQRQIIIDTEKLIEEKSSMTEEEFRHESDRIGREQALLRLNFGHYLGLENESGTIDTGISPEDFFVDSDDHGHEHAHDHSDHEDLDEHGFETSQSAAAANIPEEFMHDHGSAEMNTLFGNNPRALLRESLGQMWQAERHLRMFQPEEALPYEYRALELLQEAQRAERRYVRRVGYELPPIPVEEKRLTGTYDDFGYPSSEFNSEFEPGPLARLQVMIRLNSLENEEQMEQAAALVQQAEISETDRLFLLNRLRIVENGGMDTGTRQELLQKLSELDRQTDRDPVPGQRPSLGRISGSR